MNAGHEQAPAHPRQQELAADLLRVLGRHTAMPGLAYAVPPAPLAGGFWAALYGFRLAHGPQELSGDLVARVMPTDEEHCRREALMQSAAAGAGFPAPRIHLTGGREAGLGRPFIIMDRAPGGTLASGLDWREKALALASMPVLLAETMARLHALDPAVVAASPAAVGVTMVLAELAERIEPLGLASFGSAMAWLYEHQPVEHGRVICHGDIHPFNLAIVDGRASALLDWTNAVLADPAFDVAYTYQLLALWPVAVPGLPRSLLKHVAGRFAAWRFLSEYRRRAHIETGALGWYEALHSLRLLTRATRWRMGITRPPRARNHPWQLAALDAAGAFHRHTGIRIELPPARSEHAASH
jgi:aminoglycoside phosphotransferase (APT) family kinase protein